LKRRFIILISLALGLSLSAGSVQAAPKAATVTKIAQQLKKQHFTGTVLIVRNGHTVLQRSYGYANFAKLQRNSAASTYQLASVQKVFTAVLFMQLVETGKVRLNTPLSQYYPQIKHSNQITLRQMLDMNSGLFTTTEPQKMLSDRQLIKFAVKHVQVKHIGQHNYEPVNYLLLTGIIEQITGQSYRHLVPKRLLQPLKLHHTGFVLDGFKQETHAALAYQTKIAFLPYLFRVHTTRVAVKRKLGTGNMYSTASELFRLEQAIQQGRLLKPASIATLFNATDGSYRGGLYNYRYFFVSHGVENGYESGLALSRDGNSGVILLSNRRIAGSLSHKARQIYRQLEL
jgi:CubicO group peptidase (beta-lactamase class C family)